MPAPLYACVARTKHTHIRGARARGTNAVDFWWENALSRSGTRDCIQRRWACEGLFKLDETRMLSICSTTVFSMELHIAV